MAATKVTALETANPDHPKFAMEHSPFYWLARVVHRYGLNMDAILKRIGMDVPRWRVLMTLMEIDPASVTQLSEHGVIKLSTMTKIVKRLEIAGLVETRPRATDARVTEVTLSPAGRECVRGVRARASRVYLQAFEGVPPEQLEALIKTLRHVFGNLGNGAN